jgi:hypothetical protein
LTGAADLDRARDQVMDKKGGGGKKTMYGMKKNADDEVSAWRVWERGVAECRFNARKAEMMLMLVRVQYRYRCARERSTEHYRCDGVVHA